MEGSKAEQVGWEGAAVANKLLHTNDTSVNYEGKKSLHLKLCANSLNWKY